ncbi:MotA/TolQ/ExbB proton channel family protein [Rivihabitans pingtungensis]|jgi:biopolymer transport protein ExbB|uniref:Biopolymer transport protein ExbB n=1 Tax=Rivihabitans pingtungensis TaxID=1054498 RepID=A0A318KND5_9NEIS|nr:MotA/TolQ/ExbB proton channel family protein [Rivihabitans pingtungensis]MCK6436997.1 MotA/TolQ/ExbB proton channel family protein [Rivihabitans pingtungensis]PXX79301.1 outer membrane transport energization protein ExbB [Rivihabitans pingtungensis]HNX72470.1 MotA/TolQ/ExbB proton channel family protein [Rivihabitans pingtungensis]
MDLSLVFRQGDGVLMSVFLLLLAMSVTSWWLILRRSLSRWSVRQANQQLSQAFWDAPDLDAAARLAEQHDAPLARIARAGLDGLGHYRRNQNHALGQACGIDEFLVRTIRMALARETARLESGLTWLATVGSVAPFVGLFGTVWGIYHALVGIGAAGQITLAAVSGPIGEALVATAAGLAAAIPAVVAYNAFTRVNRVDSQEMDGFAHDFHAQLIAAGGQHGVREL